MYLFLFPLPSLPSLSSLPLSAAVSPTGDRRQPSAPLLHTNPIGRRRRRRKKKKKKKKKKEKKKKDKKKRERNIQK